MAFKGRGKSSVDIELNAKDKASKEVKKVENSFQKLGGFLKNKFALGAAAAAGALVGLVATLKSAVDAAQVQEDAVNKLNASLAKLGPTSDKVSKALQAQAAAIEEVTRFGDEAVIQAQAMLATIGVQAEKLPDATKATVELAAALGIDLQAAAVQVGKTFAGSAGELAEFVPALRELSPEALKAGGAIKLLNDQFGGRAAADVQTFSGRMDQLKNSFGSVLEGIGVSITGNKEFKDSILEVTTFLKANTVEIARTAAAMVNFAVETVKVGTVIFKWYITPLSKAVELLQIFSSSLDDTLVSQEALAATAERTGKSQEQLRKELGLATSAYGAYKKAQKESNEEQEKSADAAETVAEATAKAAAALSGLGDNAGDVAADLAAAEAAMKKNAEAAKRMGEAYSDALSSVSALGDTTSALLSAEFLEIEKALLRQKDILGENSLEYKRLAENAREAQDKILDRIDNLKAGLGDLKDETESAADAQTKLANSTNTATAALERQAQVTGTGSVGTTGLQFAQGKFVFIDGRRAKVYPDGRVEYP